MKTEERKVFGQQEPKCSNVPLSQELPLLLSPSQQLCLAWPEGPEKLLLPAFLYGVTHFWSLWRFLLNYSNDTSLCNWNWESISKRSLLSTPTLALHVMPPNGDTMLPSHLLPLPRKDLSPFQSTFQTLSLAGRGKCPLVKHQPKITLSQIPSFRLFISFGQFQLSIFVQLYHWKSLFYFSTYFELGMLITPGLFLKRANVRSNWQHSHLLHRTGLQQAQRSNVTRKMRKGNAFFFLPHSHSVFPTAKSLWLFHTPGVYGCLIHLFYERTIHP